MKIAHPRIIAAVIVIVFSAGSLWISTSQHVAPSRESFALFPMTLGPWRGQKSSFDKEIIDALKFDDYLLANYRRPGSDQYVNLYVAYYAQQKLGSASHSPRTCIPGGGWEIETLGRRVISRAGMQSFAVNRAVISKGRDRQLVYYWFQQRGRHLTDEFRVKWYLIKDGLLKNRSDGALIRLVVPVGPKGIKHADQSLVDFIRALNARFDRFVPS